MKHLIVLLLTFAHGGYWLGGHTESVSIAWPAESGMPAVMVHWECTMGSVILAAGNADMPDAGHPLKVSLSVPRVRVTTRIHFSCTARDNASDQRLAGGENDIVVYPDDLPGDFQKQYAGKRLVLLSHSGSLLKSLEKANIHAGVIEDWSQLALTQPDVLIVGPEELKPRPLEQPRFLQMAERGCQIIVLHQSTAGSIAGYRLGQREAVSDLSWKPDHALLADLDSDMLQAWVGHGPVMAVQLPAGDASLKLGGLNPEAPSHLASPVDVLLVSKTLGHGRIVFCQLPTDDWDDDPRSLILLRNILDYATTLPEPTPPPKRRCTPTAAPIRSERNILAPVGERP